MTTNDDWIIYSPHRIQVTAEPNNHRYCKYPECMPPGTQCRHDRKDYCLLNSASSEKEGK